MPNETQKLENMASYVRDFLSKARTAGKVTAIADRQGWFQTAVYPSSDLAQGAATLQMFGIEIEVQAQWSKESTEEAGSLLGLNAEDYATWLRSKDKTHVLVKWSKMFEDGK